MNNDFSDWVEKHPYYWINKITGWIVRDHTTEDGYDGWVIINNNGMMVSCEISETKEDGMGQADFIVAQEKKYGYFKFDEIQSS
jgi:hypothetical protein